MLDKIESAYKRIKKFTNLTPVFRSRILNKKLSANFFIKAENMQRAGAFKFRGAFNAISQLSKEQKERGIVTHSSGNHAQAVALAGNILGIETLIIMPNNVPKVKLNATKEYGAQVVFCEPTQISREETSQKFIDSKGYTLIHPYDNENVIFGAGTTALELVHQVGELDYLICPIGGGGLISGCSIFSKESGTIRNVIGIEPEGANDAMRSFYSGDRVIDQIPNTIADGLRTTLSKRTFKYITSNVDEIKTVTDNEIIDAMKFYMQFMKIIVEPSGAVTLAALLSSKINYPSDSKIGVIISGGNTSISSLFELMNNAK